VERSADDEGHRYSRHLTMMPGGEVVRMIETGDRVAGSGR
jgi:hypothetical protein